MSDLVEKISQTAYELFHRFGIRSVSMDDIARELSISKKTIYQYFKDKDEMVTHGVMRHIEREINEFTGVLEKSNNAVLELVNLSTCIKRNMKKINPSMLFDLQKFHPEAWTKWLEFKNDFIKKTVLEVIRRGKKEGYFRSDVNEEMMAIYRIETIELTFNQTIFPQHEWDFVEVQLALMDHFLRGMMTIKGIEYYEELHNSINNENI
ncbi:TetR/AcrR family transcriptional regulator [Reichenbachiella ulvae]|uniref:TetR/AcrR family transcriptional regulator n=1 Tax=Reichenbachiella ulvae TaxID=2980104 RepID=A0ABT3CQS7_9BACT|nr:TetR/AcrR family transcriptional regulator [Reichenbachiella ulvae]MCV9385618.1 TetR/AcrR family transcriptional regulator [Reichenbachiella ulvae]